MWIFFAVGSAFFAGVTAVLAKCGIRRTDSDVATALRTIIVLMFSWIMVFLIGSSTQICEISGYTWTLLILSVLCLRWWRTPIRRSIITMTAAL